METGANEEDDWEEHADVLGKQKGTCRQLILTPSETAAMAGGTWPDGAYICRVWRMVVKAGPIVGRDPTLGKAGKGWPAPAVPRSKGNGKAARESVAVLRRRLRGGRAGHPRARRRVVRRSGACQGGPFARPGRLRHRIRQPLCPTPGKPLGGAFGEIKGGRANASRGRASLEPGSRKGNSVSSAGQCGGGGRSGSRIEEYWSVGHGGRSRQRIVAHVSLASRFEKFLD